MTLSRLLLLDGSASARFDGPFLPQVVMHVPHPRQKERLMGLCQADLVVFLSAAPVDAKRPPVNSISARSDPLHQHDLGDAGAGAFLLGLLVFG